MKNFKPILQTTWEVWVYYRRNWVLFSAAKSQEFADELACELANSDDSYDRVAVVRCNRKMVRRLKKPE